MTEKETKIACRINVTITYEDIDDIMSSALDAGIGYWCTKAEVDGDYLGEYASEQISRGGKLKLYDYEGEQVLTLTKEKFLDGIRKYIEDPEFGDNVTFLECSGTGLQIDPCNIDGCIADSIIQLAIFGELIYA